MFEFVNEIAVLGTSFFMMAVATLWYSDHLFQKQWMNAVGFTKEDVGNASVHMKRNFVITFLFYVVVIYIIAGVIGYAQVNDLSVQKIGLIMSLAFASLSAGFVVWEQRSLSYYFVTVGFSTVFILGSTFFLYYWPW